MSTRILSLVFALALVGCGDKGDTGEVEETDTEDTDTDTEDTDTDTEAEVYLEPTSLFVRWQVAITDGQIDAGVDANYGNYFSVYLVSDYWDGTNDDTEACIAFIEVSSISVDSGFIDAGGWNGWSVPAGSSYATSPGCKLVDPAGQFGSDPAGYFVQNYNWGFGIAPDSGEFTDFLSEYYDAWLDGLLYHEVTGTAAYDTFNYVIAYETNDKGGVDGNTLLDLSGLTAGDTLPDGYYIGGVAYGFTFN